MTAPPSPDPLPRAPLQRRFAALLYEALLLVAMVLIAGFALIPFVSPQAVRAEGLALPTPLGRAISFLALLGLGALFFGWIWSEGRRTLPMKTWRLVLTDANGAAVSRRRAYARYFALWIGPALALLVYLLAAPVGLGALAWPLLALNWLAALVDPERQFLHDRIAGTRLVTALPRPEAASAAAPSAPPQR